jgi:hypothetical protein
VTSKPVNFTALLSKLTLTTAALKRSAFYASAPSYWRLIRMDIWMSGIIAANLQILMHGMTGACTIMQGELGSLILFIMNRRIS